MNTFSPHLPCQTWLLSLASWRLLNTGSRFHELAGPGADITESTHRIPRTGISPHSIGHAESSPNNTAEKYATHNNLNKEQQSTNDQGPSSSRAEEDVEFEERSWVTCYDQSWPVTACHGFGV